MKDIIISKKKVSIVNLLFNYANTLFLIVNGLVLLPMYLTHFSINTYGSYLSSGNIVGMLGLLDAGMSLVLTQKLSTSYAKKDFKSFTQILGAGLFLSFILTVLLVLISLLLLPFIPDWVKAEPNEYKNIQYAFLLSAIGAGLNISCQNLSSVFQSWLKVKVSGYANVISAILGIISTFVGLKLGLGVVSIPLGVFVKGLLSVIVLAVFLIINLRRDKYPQIVIKKDYCIDLIKSCLPVLGGNVTKSFIDNSQLLVITNFINPAASAIFVITNKVYQVCSTLLAPIGSSIYSSISQLVGEGDSNKIKESIIKVFTYFSLFSAIILSTGLALNSAFISLWVGPENFGGILLSILLCINVFVSSRFVFVNFNLFALGIFGKTVLYDQISSVIRVILIFALIRTIGFIAIPISELLSITFLSGYFVNKLIVNKLDLNHQEIIKFISSGLFIFIGSVFVAIIWQYFFPLAKNWVILIGQSIAFLSLLSILVFLCSNEARIFFSDLLLNKIKIFALTLWKFKRK